MTNNLTLEELLTQKEVVTPEEIEAAKKYERSLIPDNASIPSAGQVYRATVDTEATIAVLFKGPYSGGNKLMVPAETRVRILESHDKMPIYIKSEPNDKKAFGERFLADVYIEDPKYSEYFLFFKTTNFLNNFELE